MNKTIVVAYHCGGIGTFVGAMVMDRIGPLPGLAWRVIDTKTPPGLPKSRAIELSPQLLPTTPTERIAELLRMTSIRDHEEYRRYCGFVSAKGLARLPAMTAIAAFLKMDEIKEAIEIDVRAAAEAVGGAEHLYFVTLASAIGATGTATARVAGLAFRLAARGVYLPHSARWLHVLVTSSVLGDDCRTPRTLALEHRQLEELEALMTPGAALRIPGQRDPIHFPGPDQIIVIGSSPEAPRTLNDCTSELASVMKHWLAV